MQTSPPERYTPFGLLMFAAVRAGSVSKPTQSMQSHCRSARPLLLHQVTALGGWHAVGTESTRGAARAHQGSEVQACSPHLPAPPHIATGSSHSAPAMRAAGTEPSPAPAA